jgi:mycothiol system anti-sigma-R factor
MEYFFHSGVMSPSKGVIFLSSCEHYRERILLYFDGLSSEADGRRFREHLQACESCRGHAEQEQHLSQLLSAAPLTDTAPQELRARVQQLLENAIPLSAWERFLEALRSRFRPHLAGRAVAGVAGALVLCVVLMIPFGERVFAGTFIRAAVDAHHRYESGAMPLELQSNAPASVTSWIQQRVPFHFRLPEKERSPNQPVEYRLSGASILDYRKKKVALVVYQMQTKEISLLVAPADSAILTGGQEVRIGKLAFHYRSSGDLQVITWSNHGLAYALVSPQKGGTAEASCLVCHQDMADHGVFKQSGELRLPRPWEMR